MWPSISKAILQSEFYFGCVGGWRGRTHFFFIVSEPFSSIMGNAHFSVTWSLHNYLHMHPKLPAEQENIYPPYFPPTVRRFMQSSNTDEAPELLVLFCHLKELTAIRKLVLNRT